MDDLGLLVALLGLGSSIIGVAAIFLMPFEHIKVYAAAVGLFAAIAVCLLPVKIAGPEGEGEIECGSVLRPKDIPSDEDAAFTPAELLNAGLRALERESLMQDCGEKRRKALYVALAIGLLSLIVFVENVAKVRKANSRRPPE